jgi:hypothetical protein
MWFIRSPFEPTLIERCAPGCGGSGRSTPASPGAGGPPEEDRLSYTIGTPRSFATPPGAAQTGEHHLARKLWSEAQYARNGCTSLHPIYSGAETLNPKVRTTKCAGRPRRHVRLVGGPARVSDRRRPALWRRTGREPRAERSDLVAVDQGCAGGGAPGRAGREARRRTSASRLRTGECRHRERMVDDFIDRHGPASLASGGKIARI